MRKLGRAIAAVGYREVVWFRRFVADYVVAWLLPLIFGLSIVFLPASVGGVQRVLHRMGEVLGRSIGLREALAYGVALSSVISVVGAVIGDVVQTLINEVKVAGVIDSILLSVDLGSYATAVAIVRSATLCILTTLYLPIALVATLGVKGLAIYLAMLGALEVSSVALGCFATLIALPIAFFTNVSRPWAIGSILVPAILAGAGLYVPLSFVPAVLRAIASITPVPELCTLIRVLVVWGWRPEVLISAALMCALLAIYLAASTYLSRACGHRVRRGL